MQRVSKKNIFCAAFATAVEYYDFVIYAYLAIYISKIFFPNENGSIQILEAYALFAIGYFMRPLGGIFFGHFGDKVGRKKTLVITVLLMTISLIVITFLPDYKHIGVFSSIILLLARLLQGFSLGGEYNGVLTTLIENAPDNRRGLITSFGTLISGSGVLLATIIVMGMTFYFSEQDMLDYGWRIPYAIGMLLSIVSVFLIFQLDETEHFKKAKLSEDTVKVPLLTAFKEYPWSIFLVFSLAGYLGIAYYMAANYLPNMMINLLHINHKTVMLATVIAAACYAFTAPIWGNLSDKVGRKPILLTSITLIGVLIYPAYLMIATSNLLYITVVYCILMLLISACTATFVVAINEAFPTRIRFSGVAFGYNVGNAVLGGTVLFVSRYLVYITGNYLSPAIYLAIVSIFLVVIVSFMKETYKEPLTN